MVVDKPREERDPQAGDYFEDWLSHIAGRVRPKTLEGYQALIRRHALPSLGPIPLRALHPLDLQRLYADLLR